VGWRNLVPLSQASKITLSAAVIAAAATIAAALLNGHDTVSQTGSGNNQCVHSRCDQGG
jgi:hypothetical protein